MYQVVREDVVDRIAALQVLDLDVDVVVEPRKEEEDEPVAQVRDHEARDDDEEQPSAEERGQRMQPMPLSVAERRRRVRRLGGGSRRGSARGLRRFCVH